MSGPLADRRETDLFTVQGKIATTAGVTAELATYSCPSPGSGLVDVFATTESVATQAIGVSTRGPRWAELRWR